MATQVLTDVRCYVGGLDATGQTNQLALEGAAVDLDKTTFGSLGWMERQGGLKSHKIGLQGFYAAGAVVGLDQQDDRMWADTIGGVSVPITLAGTSGAVGAPCYVGRALNTSYKLLGKVGDLAPFQLDTVSDGPLGDGNILHPQGTPRTVTGVGTGVQFPALVTGQKMWMALHVLSVAGTTPTLAVIVQSDTSNVFGAPTTRGTFAGVTTATGGQILSVAGPITDTWWRISWTIGGTTPSYLLAASAGIA